MCKKFPSKSLYNYQGFFHSFIKLKSFCIRHYPIIIIAFFSVIALLPFWLNQQYTMGHDSNFHLAQIIGLSRTDLISMFNAKVIDFIGNGLGYPSGVFYPQLSHIIPALILQILGPFGMSVFVASRFAHLLILFASGILIYILLRLLKADRLSALIAAILYQGSTYHLSNILIRDAQAESLIFVFIPLITISLYYLYRQQYVKFLPIFVVGVAGLILSHLTIIIWVALFFVLFLVLNWRAFIKPKNLLYLTLGCIISLLVTAYFWMPLLENLSATYYTAFTDNFMIPDNSLQASLYSFFDYSTDANHIIWTANLAGIIFLLYIYTNNPKIRHDHLINSLLALSILALICIVFLPFDKLPGFLQMTQYLWRLNTIFCFCFTLAISLSLSYLRHAPAQHFWCSLIVLFTIIGIAAVWQQVTINYNTNLETIKYQTATFADYLPVKSMEHRSALLQRNANTVKVQAGTASINYLDSTFPNLSFSVQLESGSATLELPRYYTLGYRVQLLTTNGGIVEIPYEENDYGLIQITVTESSVIELSFPGTTLQQFSTLLSFTTAVVFFTSCAIYLYTHPKTASRTKLLS